MTSDPQLFIKLAYRLSQRSISKSPLNLEEVFADMRSSDDFGIGARICWLSMRPSIQTFDMEGLEVV